YVDDYFFLCDKGQAALCYQIFIRLNELLGFEVKREKIDDDPITLDICPDRAKRLTKTIDDHLQSASITPTQASKLAGRQSFAATSFHSRCGRAFLRALYHRANDTNYGDRGNNNDEALAALRWFRWAITACPSKIVYLHTNTPHVILYTDAEFSYTGDPPTAKSGGIGAVLAIPNHQRVFCLSWPLPADVFDFLEQRQTDIHPLEVMAIPIALHHWLTTMVPLQLSCSSFYFGEPAASTSPSTRTPRDINNLVAATWKLCAENNTPHDISRHLEAKRILRHLRSVESSTFKTYLQGARHYARLCGALGVSDYFPPKPLVLAWWAIRCFRCHSTLKNYMNG
ncbi:hypothetical protein FOZ62_007152, partial [Perkinsus olseni]